MKAWNKIYKNKAENYTYYDLNEAHEDLGNIIDIFKKEKIKRVLDLGCGIGRNLIPLAKHGFIVDGIDYAPEAIKQTKSILKKEKLKATLIEGNIYKTLPYKNESFDGLISVQVIQHANENNLVRAIKEIYRVLKPGGIIFVTVCGRISKGKVRYCLVKTAKKIAPNTYVPSIGDEKGQVHFIYTKSLIYKHFKNFKIKKIWKDDRDYYCFIAQKHHE